jgi:hypothetical protein
MATREPGNKEVFGTPSPQSSPSREDSIIARTKAQAFPAEDSQISLENFEHKGDKPAGTQNSVADMQNLTGKDLNESYRAGLSKSATNTDRVSDR